MSEVPSIERRLNGLVPHIVIEVAHLRRPDPTMDGRHHPTPSEQRLAQSVIDWVKFAMTDEWLIWCHEECDYHASPHRGCWSTEFVS